MSNGMQEETLFTTIAALLGVVGTLMLALAPFRDRSRGRRRCPKCWYDLSASGNENLCCGECGHLARRENKLYKTRRHWRWARFAIILLLGAVAAHHTPKVRRDGWWAIVPTTVLIMYLPSYPDRAWSPYLELERRMPNPHRVAGTEPPEWWQWQWRMLIHKCIEGDSERTPTSREWHYYYGLCLDSAMCNAFLLDDSKIRRNLAEAFPITVEIRPINMVVVGHSLHCQLDAAGGSSRWVVYRVDVDANLPKHQLLSAEGNPFLRAREYGFVGVLPKNVRTVEFEVSIYCRPLGEDDHWLPYDSTRILMPLEPSESYFDS